MLIPHYMTRLEADIALEDLLLEQCEIVYGKKESTFL